MWGRAQMKSNQINTYQIILIFEVTFVLLPLPSSCDAHKGIEYIENEDVHCAYCLPKLTVMKYSCRVYCR